MSVLARYDVFVGTGCFPFWCKLMHLLRPVLADFEVQYLNEYNLDVCVFFSVQCFACLQQFLISILKQLRAKRQCFIHLEVLEPLSVCSVSVKANELLTV